FIEKMAAGGFVKLKQVDRSLLVELKDTLPPEAEEAAVEREAVPQAAPASTRTPAPAPAPPPTNGQVAESAGPTPTPMQSEEIVRAMQEAFQNSKVTPHWPMYLRNVKQFIKNSSPTFDEHRYGFHSFFEAVRSA